MILLREKKAEKNDNDVNSRLLHPSALNGRRKVQMQNHLLGSAKRWESAIEAHLPQETINEA